MASSAKFWNKMAQRYARSKISDMASYEKKLEISRTYFEPHMKALEFGCGTGSTALLHAPHLAHIHAIDLASAMVEIAEEKRVEAGIENVSFAVGTLESLQPDAGPFDIIFGLSVLHLLEDRDEAIARVFQRLKPGGVFISSTACLGDSMLAVFKVVGPVGRALGLMPTLRVFTGDALRASMTRAGFEIVEDWQPSKTKALFLVARKSPV